VCEADHASTKLEYAGNEQVCGQHGEGAEKLRGKAEEEISRTGESREKIQKLNWSETRIYGRVLKVRAGVGRDVSDLCGKV
jgi:hypothetical protein